MNTWIIGCGDIGRRVARLYQKVTVKDKPLIKGLVYSRASQQICEQMNIHTFQADLDSNTSLQAEIPADLFKQAQVFYFAPPPKTGVCDTRLQDFLNHISDKVKKIVLISTTGVYGDSQGEWIDETTPIAPKADRAKRRANAEQQLQQWAKRYQKDIVILRVPGIYASDRLPLTRLKKGLAVVKASEAGWTNRIHADDLAQVCQQAMQLDLPQILYNVTDGSPSSMTDYFNQVADYAGLKRPPQISMQTAIETLSKGMVSYLQESRRIKNQSLLDDFNLTLQYPDLKAGLMTKYKNSKSND